MTWYIYCYTAYRLQENHRYFPADGDASHLMHLTYLSFVEFDPDKLHDSRTRHMVMSVMRAPKSIHHYGCYMNMGEIVPVQFFPKPLSLGRFFGLDWDPKRVDPALWGLITCKTTVDPRKRYTY